MALQQFNLKLLPETIELWKNTFSNSEAETGNEFAELLLEKFLNPKVKNVEVFKLTPEKEQEFQNLVNEIGRLKTALSLSQDRVTELETINSQLETVNSELETRNPQPGTPTENQLLIEIAPLVGLVLDKEAELAAKQTGTQWDRAKVLLNSFWESIDSGRSYPFKVWTKSDLQKLAKQITPAAPANE